MPGGLGIRFRLGQVLARSCRLGFAERQQRPLGRRSLGLNMPFGHIQWLAYRSTLSPAELGAPARAHRQELKMPQAFSTPEVHSPGPMLAGFWCECAFWKRDGRDELGLAQLLFFIKIL